MYMYDNVIYGVDQNHQLNCLTNKYRGLKSFCKVKDTSKVKMTAKKNPESQNGAHMQNSCHFIRPVTSSLVIYVLT